MVKYLKAKIDAAKERNLNKEEFGNKLFNRMWQNQSNFTMKSINNSGLTKDEIKKSWLATGGFLGFKEMMKDELIVKMILGGSKFDTGYKNVGLRKAVGAFKTVVDSIFKKKTKANSTLFNKKK